MIGTGGSCYYDIRANNNFLDFPLSFPRAQKDQVEQGEKEEEERTSNDDDQQ